MKTPLTLDWSHLFDGMSNKQIRDFWKDHATDLKELDDHKNHTHQKALPGHLGLAGDSCAS